jgi:hypothetical protein
MYYCSIHWYCFSMHCARLVAPLAAVACLLPASFGTPTARADQVAYLVNVTVRPGYGFPNAQAALDYGYGVCDRIDRGVSDHELLGQVRSDFGGDDYQGTYFINQAVNELCPADIWQLRQSAGAR